MVRCCETKLEEEENWTTFLWALNLWQFAKLSLNVCDKLNALSAEWMNEQTLCSKDENTQYGCVLLWNKNWRFREKSAELKCNVVMWRLYRVLYIFSISIYHLVVFSYVVILLLKFFLLAVIKSLM